MLIATTPRPITRTTDYRGTMESHDPSTPTAESADPAIATAQLYADRVSKGLGRAATAAATPPQVLWLPPHMLQNDQAPTPAPAGPPLIAATQTNSDASSPPATRPSNPASDSIAQSPATQPAASPDLDAQALATRLAACIDNDAEPAMAKAMRLASLRLAQPHGGADPSAVAGLDSQQRALVKHYQELLGALSSQLLAGQPLTRDLLLSQLEAMDLGDPLKIRTMRLCRRVRGFGAYEPIDSSSLLVGRDHPMIVYLELDHFRSVPVGEDRREVRLAQEVVLYSESDGLAVWRQPRVQIVDESRNARRDFFVVQQIELPARLTVGKYLLKVRVTDLNAQTVDERTSPISLVADASLATAAK